MKRLLEKLIVMMVDIRKSTIAISVGWSIPNKSVFPKLLPPSQKDTMKFVADVRNVEHLRPPRANPSYPFQPQQQSTPERQ